MEKLREVICSASWELTEQCRKTAQEIIMKHAITPKHETVEQWEKRTGETYPDDGPVWEYDEWSRYRLSTHEEATKRIRFYGQGHEIVANLHGKPDSIGER